MPSVQQQVNITCDITVHFSLQVWKENDETGELTEAIEQQMLVWSNKKQVWIYCDSHEPPTQTGIENIETKDAKGAKEEGVEGIETSLNA